MKPEEPETRRFAVTDPPMLNEMQDPVRASFKRITSPGWTDAGRLFITIKWDGRRLSITGVEGPKANGDCRGSCGQTGIPLFADRMAEDWEESIVKRLRAVWDRWHLNDMQPACEHQRTDKAFDRSRPLELQHLTWGPRYYPAMKAAESGEMGIEEYADFAWTSRQVRALTLGHNTPKHPDLWTAGFFGDRLIEEGWLKIEKTETKTAGWVDYREHPEGLLSKPCPVCGYAYGTAWLHVEVPSYVLEFLRGLPDNADDMPRAWGGTNGPQRRRNRNRPHVSLVR